MKRRLSIEVPTASTYALPWPDGLRSRIVQMVEAAQALDIDRVVELGLSLDRQLWLIEKTELEARP